MRFVMFSSVLVGLLVIGIGCTYVPYFAWCTYWGDPISGHIGRHFIFSPPSKAQALHELKDVVDHRTGDVARIPLLNITENWKEKVAATDFEPMTPLQRDQSIQSIFAGLAFIIFPFLYRSRRKKNR